MADSWGDIMAAFVDGWSYRTFIFMTSSFLTCDNLAAAFWESLGQVVVAPYPFSWVAQGKSMAQMIRGMGEDDLVPTYGMGENPTWVTLLPNVGTCWMYACFMDGQKREIITPFAFSVC